MGVAMQAKGGGQDSRNAALDIMAGPLDLASVSLQLELVLASLAALEPKNAAVLADKHHAGTCLLYTSPSPRDLSTSRMPSSA